MLLGMDYEKIELTEDQAAFVRERVESGDYDDANEVVGEALRLLRDQQDPEYVAWLRGELQKGMDDIKAGRYVELNSREDIDALGRDVCRRGMERLEKEKNDPPAKAQ